MRHEVEDALRVGAHAHRQEHVAELAYRGIRKHFLDVVLANGDGRGEKGGGCRDDRYHVQRRRRHREKEAQPRDHVDAGRHHGRGVNQRAHGRRSCHSVRQPDMEGDLRRLTGGADEEK